MRKKHVLALMLTLLIVFSSTPNVNAESAQTMNSDAFTASISGYTPPSEVLIGNTYSLKGNITSSSEISKVTVFIDGAVKGSVNCSTKSFPMSSIDAKVKFAVLTAGQHTIKIVAYGKNGDSAVVAEHKFKITNIIFGSDAKKSAVSEKSQEIISLILKNASLKTCKITSTARSPYEQAVAMYQNCNKTGGVKKQKAIYGPNGDKVIEVFEKEKAKKNGLRGDALIEKMMNKIIEIGPGKVSKHCGDSKKINVFDIGYGSLSNKAAFKKALTEYEKKNKSTFYFIDEPANSCFHIEIKQ